MLVNIKFKTIVIVGLVCFFYVNNLYAQSISDITGNYKGADSAFQNFNPDISVIVDTFYYNDDSDEGLPHIFGEMDGFGDAHSHSEEDGHDHGGYEDGFNLRHLEIYFSADVDPYFKGWAIAAISEDDAELEEAVIQTTFLPYGLQIKGGKFFSDFGRINPVHAHAWDFVDQPMIYELTFGDHGLNDKGVQASWLAPTPFYWLCGIEAFQGDNEKLFNYIGDEPLPDKDGPRAYVGWMKFGPNLPDAHGFQIGFSGATGVHQEAHVVDEDIEETHDDEYEDEHEDEHEHAGSHYLDGDSYFYGVDFVYKYDDIEPYGQGDWIIQGEYLYKKNDLDLVSHETEPGLVGNSRIDKQDGYYLQAIYGFYPRWRIGARWEEVGLTNETEMPDGDTLKFDDSWRASGMLDFSPSEFSRFRLQVSNGEYAVDGDKEDAWSVFFQCVISLGSHGAHAF